MRGASAFGGSQYLSKALQHYVVHSTCLVLIINRCNCLPPKMAEAMTLDEEETSSVEQLEEVRFFFGDGPVSCG